MDYGVFIQTNHKQILGAMVAAYAVRRYSRHNDRFEVTIIDSRDYPFFAAREGQRYMRDGVEWQWLNDDLQSFTPVRFMPPQLMGYQGRAVVIDPDVFAAADVWDLLTRDMQGKAILCRMRSGPKGLIDRCYASSVMLLDCARLRHWDVEAQFNRMFDGDLDYKPWICLNNEDPQSIGFFEKEWNDFDRFTTATRLLHTTRRKTQPWKTGLRVDWRLAERFRLFPPIGWLMRARRRLFGVYGLLGHYAAHPDPNQEWFFFALLKECLEQGEISEAFLVEEMRRDHVRHDALEVLARTPPLPPPDCHPLAGNAARKTAA
ncbi:MAG TPA: hypothetical protein VK973_10405 [Arenicellales bacterium]|nr:hypothetical protein [Arenicellales bacterium]